MAGIALSTHDASPVMWCAWCRCAAAACAAQCWLCCADPTRTATPCAWRCACIYLGRYALPRAADRGCNCQCVWHWLPLLVVPVFLTCVGRLLCARANLLHVQACALNNRAAHWFVSRAFAYLGSSSSTHAPFPQHFHPPNAKVCHSMLLARGHHMRHTVRHVLRASVLSAADR